MAKKLTLPSQECEVVAEVDVLVVGGGAGGIGAAIGAAQNGASVAIVDLYGSLGGLLTNGFITNCEAAVAVSGDNILIKGVFERLVDRMVEKRGAIRGYELVKSNKYYLFEHGEILDPVKVPQVKKYPVYESPLKKDPSLLQKYI